ncbi:MAG: DUF1289 domain-containing protein [Alphaproteobacteria bacterium]
MGRKKIRSPCIGVCRIDRVSGFCTGCARTPAEIRRWKRSDDTVKRLILAALPGRGPVLAAGRLRVHRGGCHCGNVSVVFETRQKRKALRPRACQCDFCRAHGARTVTDPAGVLRIAVADEARCSLYRFGLRTADYLVCGACGVYVAALLREEDGIRATLNLNVLAGAARFPKKPLPVAYDGEDAAARIARRRESWTPVAALNLDLDGSRAAA